MYAANWTLTYTQYCGGIICIKMVKSQKFDFDNPNKVAKCLEAIELDKNMTTISFSNLINHLLFPWETSEFFFLWSSKIGQSTKQMEKWTGRTFHCFVLRTPDVSINWCYTSGDKQNLPYETYKQKPNAFSTSNWGKGKGSLGLFPPNGC